ncbi:hypothetical protein BDW42DRAFT_134475 [Aspergillus taichungensis]|uniref:AN1-type domain-containing protein n=1 Tax=Aspergillus taichungensis TaxID=482145 RepID=A0A2J5HPG7_9EURO|nr:hypothetical protein BDW42DRAFT_134475 [Aspergillus taichungensis]
MSPITINKAGRGSSADSDPPNASSFTQMADKDLESIGRHCQFEYCNQLDFLPFRCESCHGTYCLDHRTETAHRCAHAGEWARRRAGAAGSRGPAPEKPTIYNSDQCAHTECKTLVNTLKDPGVRCPDCTRLYCLRHRLREEHDCARVGPGGRRQAGTGGGGGGGGGNDALKSMFARVRTWGKDKTQQLTPAPKANSPAARTLQLNALKKTAKGDAGVPADRRIYLHVVGTSETQRTDPPRGEFFFDSRWKVGRVLDDAARRLHVENVNNRAGEEDRLRVFHLESGEFLEFAETIGGGRVAQGNTLVMLRGAGVMLGK